MSEWSVLGVVFSNFWFFWFVYSNLWVFAREQRKCISFFNDTWTQMFHCSLSFLMKSDKENIVWPKSKNGNFSNNLRCPLTRNKCAGLFVPQQNSLALMELYTCNTWTKGKIKNHASWEHFNICPGKGGDECDQYSAPRVTMASPIPMKMTMKTPPMLWIEIPPLLSSASSHAYTKRMSQL